MLFPGPGLGTAGRSYRYPIGTVRSKPYNLSIPTDIVFVNPAGRYPVGGPLRGMLILASGPHCIPGCFAALKCGALTRL
jgi:hypothetical protein